ncbi:collagen alpha-1(III) chain-like [Columba livia]|uniref:collagen alpha-1(III) chain-like n=1 Tax=Columba livia TaxID=8932 RepID=UPI0031BB533F
MNVNTPVCAASGLFAVPSHGRFHLLFSSSCFWFQLLFSSRNPWEVTDQYFHKLRRQNISLGARSGNAVAGSHWVGAGAAFVRCVPLCVWLVLVPRLFHGSAAEPAARTCWTRTGREGAPGACGQVPDRGSGGQGPGDQAEPCPEHPTPATIPRHLAPPASPTRGPGFSPRQVNGTRESVIATGGAAVPPKDHRVALRSAVPRCVRQAAPLCGREGRSREGRSREGRGLEGRGREGRGQAAPGRAPPAQLSPRSRDGAAPEASKAPPGRRGAPLRRAHAQRRERVPAGAGAGAGSAGPGAAAAGGAGFHSAGPRGGSGPCAEPGSDRSPFGPDGPEAARTCPLQLQPVQLQACLRFQLLCSCFWFQLFCSSSSSSAHFSLCLFH